MSLKRVVVTGLGAITPIGLNVPDFWSALVAGKSGGGLITRFDTTNHKVKIACEVKGYSPDNYFDKKESRRYETFVQYALVATKEALDDSGLDINDVGSENIGAVVGSGIGGISIMEEQVTILNSKGPDRVSPLLVPRMIPNIAPGQIAINFGLRGPNNCPVTACATGSNAIGDAATMIRIGQAKAMIAGGTEAAITALSIAGFGNMKALSERNDNPAGASRPFSKDRDGFVMGEGAGIVVLEEYEYAKARGAKIYGEVAGYGMACDAFHVTGVAPDHEGQQRSMKMALRLAGLQPHEVQHINAHATSTPLNDKNETAAIKAVFGDHARKMVVSANKSATGHLLGAAGGIEAVASLLAIRDGIAPPTINYGEADPECDLDYAVDGARKMDIQAVLSNSSGFGGHNVSVLFKKV